MERQHAQSRGRNVTASTRSDPASPTPVASPTPAGSVGEGDAASWWTTTAAADPEATRLLFRYLGGDEWNEYRTILRVFADTFFAEFTPDDVAVQTGIGVDTARDRLESLRRWGNLTVSSSIGNPTSLEDYYRRRHRYLITRAGQEVFNLVEGVLSAADEIGDVQSGRLRDLRRALDTVLEHITPAVGTPAVGSGPGASSGPADAVRSVFDIHERFTVELTQFFAQLNEWQNRYDLSADEVQVFASVLVDYVSEQLTDIERMAGPIARRVERVLARIDELLPALQSGLAARVDDAGLAASVTVRRLPGTEDRDWRHLAAWFVRAPGRPSRLDQHTRQALAAVRSLTTNVSRLSRLGTGMSSRRSDFVRLAAYFDGASSVEEAHAIAAAAFGLGSCRRLGVLASDADDPQPTVTPWRTAPRATVPVSLRERGDTSARGSASPMRDRSRELSELRRRRERERVVRKRTADELLACADDTGRIDGATLSRECFVMLRDLVSRSSHDAVSGSRVRHAVESGVRCEVLRSTGDRTVVASPEGSLAMHDMVVTVTPSTTADGA